MAIYSRGQLQTMGVCKQSEPTEFTTSAIRTSAQSIVERQERSERLTPEDVAQRYVKEEGRLVKRFNMICGSMRPIECNLEDEGIIDKVREKLQFERHKAWVQSVIAVAQEKMDLCASGEIRIKDSERRTGYAELFLSLNSRNLEKRKAEAAIIIGNDTEGRLNELLLWMERAFIDIR